MGAALLTTPRPGRVGSATAAAGSAGTGPAAQQERGGPGAGSPHLLCILLRLLARLLALCRPLGLRRRRRLQEQAEPATLLEARPGRGSAGCLACCDRACAARGPASASEPGWSSLVKPGARQAPHGARPSKRLGWPMPGRPLQGPHAWRGVPPRGCPPRGAPRRPAHSCGRNLKPAQPHGTCGAGTGARLALAAALASALAFLAAFSASLAAVRAAFSGSSSSRLAAEACWGGGGGLGGGGGWGFGGGYGGMVRGSGWGQAGPQGPAQRGQPAGRPAWQPEQRMANRRQVRMHARPQAGQGGTARAAAPPACSAPTRCRRPRRRRRRPSSFSSSCRPPPPQQQAPPSSSHSGTASPNLRDT